MNASVRKIASRIGKRKMNKIMIIIIILMENG